VDAPDPIAALVPEAFALGWQMAGIYRAGFEPRQPWPAAPARLPGLSGFPADQRVGLRLNEVESSIARLATALTAVGLKVPSGDRLRALYEDVTTADDAGRSAMYVLHVQLMQTLTAADFRLGTAYGLGRALGDSCAPPRDLRELARTFGPFRLTNLRAWLNDCASALPEHSAHGVLQSLARWEAYAVNLVQVGDGAPQVHGKTLEDILKRQGELWRSVLSGEKRAVDMLTSDDYRRAARALLASARRSLLKALLPVLLILAVILAAIVLLVLLIVTNGTSQLVAIATAGAGAIGVAGKSAGDTFKRTASWVERPLWGAEVNAAVAEALTYLPPTPRGSDRLLKETPRCLRKLQETSNGMLPELVKALRRWPLRAPSQEAVRYWLVWAAASGYVRPTSDTTYELTDEGRRLARISPHERGAALAALTASRPSALSEQSAEAAEA
jgi:hypothetical protein